MSLFEGYRLLDQGRKLSQQDRLFKLYLMEDMVNASLLNLSWECIKQVLEKNQIIFERVFNRYKNDHPSFERCYKLLVQGSKCFYCLLILRLSQSLSLQLILSLNQIYLKDCIYQEMGDLLFKETVIMIRVQK